MAQRWSAGRRLGASEAATDVALSDALAGRVFALFAAVILVVGGPAAATQLPLVAGVLLACGCLAVGGGLLRLVFAPPARLHLGPRVFVVTAALLSAPLVLSRADVAGVIVDRLPGRAPRTRRASDTSWAPLRSRSAGEAPWWPRDLVGFLPLADAGLASGSPPNVAVLLNAPLALPTSWWAWPLLTCGRTLTDPADRPGRGCGGLLLRVADPVAFAEALPAELLRPPLSTAARAALRPGGAPVTPRVAMLGVCAAVAIGGIAGQLGAQSRTSLSCAGVQARLNSGEPLAPERGPLRGDLVAVLPTAQAVPGFDGVASVDSVLDPGGVAASSAHPAGVIEAMAQLGWSRGQRREWYAAGGEQIAVQVEELAGGEQAVDYDTYAGLRDCGDAEGTFTTPVVPGGVGLRISAGHRVTDRLSFVRGARRYTVESTAADPLTARRRLASLAEAAVAIAR
ncbi:MAG: hypothetical protein M3415_02565 [Actinomycetota bacterium]|nr:hypothetical protein [Actinomycetota bacterium]